MSQNQPKAIQHPDWEVMADGPIRISTGLYRKGNIIKAFPEKAAAHYGAALKKVEVSSASKSNKAKAKV